MIKCLGDMHLGRVPYGKPGLASLILHQGSGMLRLATLDRQGNDLVFLAGDVYDRPEISGCELDVVNKGRIASMNSIEGNHDSRNKARNGLRQKSLSMSPVNRAVIKPWGGWIEPCNIRGLQGGIACVHWAPRSSASRIWSEAAADLIQETEAAGIRIMIGHQSIDGPGYSALAGVSSSIELPRAVVPPEIDLVVLGDYHCTSKQAVVYQDSAPGSVPFVYTGTTFSRFHSGRVVWPRMLAIHGLSMEITRETAAEVEEQVRSWLDTVSNSPWGTGQNDLQTMIESLRTFFPGFSRFEEIPTGSTRIAPGVICSAIPINRSNQGLPILWLSSVAISPLLALTQTRLDLLATTFLATICVPSSPEEHLVVDMMGETLLSVRSGSNHPTPLDIATGIAGFSKALGADCAVNLRCSPEDSARWREAFSMCPEIIHVVETPFGALEEVEKDVTLSGEGASLGFSGWVQARLQDTPGMIPAGVDPSTFRSLCGSALSLGRNATAEQLLELARSAV